MKLVEAKAVDNLLYEELPLKYFYGRNLDTAVKNQAAIRERVAQIPAVDAVPVVRCKECRYWRQEVSPTEHWVCAHHSFNERKMHTTPDFYCADGEKVSE